MPPRRKVADEPAALPGVIEAARHRRRRRRSRRRRSRGGRRSRSRSRSRSQPQEMSAQSWSPSPSSRSSSVANSAGSPSPVRRKARTTKYGNVNPFMNFAASERARMGSGAGRPAKEVARELGARWRAMPLEERQPYIAAAIKSREELDRINQSGNTMDAARMGRRRRRRRRRRGSRSRSRGGRSRSRSRSRRR